MAAAIYRLHIAPDATTTIVEALAELQIALKLLDAWETMPRWKRYFAQAHAARAEETLLEYLNDVAAIPDDPYAHQEAT